MKKSPIRPPKPEHLEFLAAYGPEITGLALAVRAVVLEHAPEAAELIYDAYNAVASGYSFTGRPGDAFIHIAVYAGWVNLGFNWGSQLKDPHRLLQGSGRRVRHVRILGPSDLKKPGVRALVREAVAGATSGDKAGIGTSVVRAIYPKRRRPGISATVKSN